MGLTSKPQWNFSAQHLQIAIILIIETSAANYFYNEQQGAKF